MSGELAISPAARADMEEIVHFLSADDPDVGERFVDEAMHTFALLADSPSVGHPYQHLRPKLKGVRSWTVSRFHNYVIFYRPGRAGVEIVRVLHGARDIEKLLSE